MQVRFLLLPTLKMKTTRGHETFSAKWQRRSVTFIVTNCILSETYTLMFRKIGLDKAIKYVESLRNTAEMERISEEDEKRRWQFILRYRDKDFSYVDATSLAVMERLGVSDAFSFDEDYEQYSLTM